MNKKGFTLIELLAILIILSAITIISVTSINSINKNSVNNNELYNTIYMAAETYIYNNYNDFKELDVKNATSLVNVIDLINNDYLKNNITNPIDNEKFTSDDYIKVIRNEDMTLSFEIVDTFPPLIKTKNTVFTYDYENRGEQFIEIIFDKDGGTFECYNQLGKISNLTLQDLPLGKNEISCVATSSNGATISYTTNITLNGYFDHKTLYVDGNKLDNIILTQNSIQHGPYYKMLKGCYKIEVNGSNLDVTDNAITYEKIDKVNYTETVLSKTGTSDKIMYYINPDENIITSGAEFVYINYRNTDVVINSVMVTLQDSCPVE